MVLVRPQLRRPNIMVLASQENPLGCLQVYVFSLTVNSEGLSINSQTQELRVRGDRVVPLQGDEHELFVIIGNPPVMAIHRDKSFSSVSLTVKYLLVRAAGRCHADH